MGNRNQLICWEENRIKKWEMIKEQDNNTFLMNLLQNPRVNNHTIFIIPCSGFVSGIWLWKNTHKSSRVDFWNFYEDYGTEYIPPEVKEENKEILHELHEKTVIIQNMDGSLRAVNTSIVDTRDILPLPIKYALA